MPRIRVHLQTNRKDFFMAPLNSSIKYTTSSKIVITSISWERIFLNLTIQAEDPENVNISIARIGMHKKQMIDSDDYILDYSNIPASLIEEYPLTPHKIEGNDMFFRINMSAVRDASFLNNGRWYFITRNSDDPTIVLCSVTYEVASGFRDLSRIFPYGQQRYSYNVYFVPKSFDSVNFVLILNSRFMVENRYWQETDLKQRKRKTLKGKVRRFRKLSKQALMQKTYDLLERHYKKDGTNVLLMSETKPYLWGNLKYIDERIKARGLDKTLHIDYSFRIAVGKSNSARSWYDTIKTLAKQDIIFVDDYVPIFGFIKLSDRTKLVQVWHAGVGFKSVGYARFGAGGSPHPVSNCHKKYDYAITGSPSLVKVYSEVFGLPEDRILPLGMARLDGFLNEDVIQSKTDDFYEYHPECRGKKLILFCPTFRGSNQKSAHYNYENLNLPEIYDFCGEDYIWAFKMHPFVHNQFDIPEQFTDRILDLSSVQNINDLYYVTDIMITDYSSAYYEFSLLRRPILFFTYDRTIYELDRGVHRSVLETAPGKVCDTFDELMNALRTGDYEIEKTIAFAEDNFGEYDGKAADRIIDTIILGGVKQ